MRPACRAAAGCGMPVGVGGPVSLDQPYFTAMAEEFLGKPAGFRFRGADTRGWPLDLLDASEQVEPRG